MSMHLEEKLQRAMDGIRSRLAEMSGLVERSLLDSLRAFHDRNRQLAYSVVLRDRRVDELEKQIDRLALEFLVKEQPVASHLRFAYVTIKINQELERIGDYAESLSRQVLKLGNQALPMRQERFQEMANLAIPMVSDAVRAFLQQDADLARRTMRTEELVNGLRDQVNEELVELSRAGRLSLEALLPLLTMARRIERVSDQAKNICEEVLYMCTGEYAKHRKEEAYRIVFVDQSNDCLSQMAEAIAAELRAESFIFSSSGLEPRPVSARLIRFLKGKGIDWSTAKSKTLDQLPNLDHYQIYIALSPEGRSVFPVPPTKAVGFEWVVPDPMSQPENQSDNDTVYEAAYQALDEHLRELIEAILGEPLE